ncbi:DUF1990 domain-containing protein [Cryobacterium sp. CG_9.6]|uniref:DUF1990 family protein n=1 Tax=Cryobacterium sp. CG_9.6 TaxID=2760710 RepID=UPI002473DA12|nr:DUF1990 domain-containing protein [Cryobacterium sp. CG_9.6]MDH6237182.1 uncharacterized protein (UPF0548 family) [Cryobacterium sp. CG_9.6]
MRRSTFTDAAVTYGAIGGTLAPDLMQYPPKGHRPLERSVRLGSGDERFHVASKLLMTWGVQRGSGMRVTDLENGTGVQYVPVEFEADGTPIPARPVTGEAVFAEDGTPYIMNGMTAQLEVHVGPLRVKAPVRVVYVIDEANRVGFAYGTMKGHPASGEESFVVEKRDDDSVWFILRAFSRPSTWYFRLASPFLRLQQKRFTRRYLTSLHPVGAL